MHRLSFVAYNENGIYCVFRHLAAEAAPSDKI